VVERDGGAGRGGDGDAGEDEDKRDGGSKGRGNQRWCRWVTATDACAANVGSSVAESSMTELARTLSSDREHKLQWLTFTPLRWLSLD